MSFSPESLQMFSTAASAVGSVIGAQGSIQSGNANASAAQYQAGIARNNALIAEQNAQYASQAGRSQESASRQKTAQLIGAQRAAMAANGIDIGSGTPLRIQGDTAAVGELDALTLRNNAARAAYGYRSQAGDFTASAGLLDRQADNYRRAGSIRAMTSIVGGASSVADKWLKWKEPTTTTPTFTEVDVRGY